MKKAHRQFPALVVFLSAIIYFTSVIPVLATSNPPTILNPSVFTFSPGNTRVDGATGALTQHIPLDFPPGRNGLQPNLSLDYNSQNTDQDNIVGYGWTLSIPYIARLNKTGSQNLYGPDAYFTSMLDGELATAGTIVTGTSTNGLASTTPLKVLVVAGGGGGGGCWSGQYYGGGGGGGGVLIDNAHTINIGHSYSVTVGSGGSGNSIGNGSQGSDSIFDNLDAVGGGYGAGQAQNGGTGGSGGGGSKQPGGTAGSGGSGTTGQGYAGGNSGVSNSGNSGGGGGGAGGSGSGWDGGPGISSSISGTLTYYGGGGGGQGSGSGGTGGGGNAGSPGTTNTGGGGGGPTCGAAGQAGGSGVVTISYPTAEASYYTCSGTTTTSGSNTICTFNSSGTFSVSSSTPLQVVTNTAPVYRARVDDGSFRQYTYATSTNTWTMYDKSGTEYIFGATSQSQQSATTSPNNVYKWMLEKEIDTNGNYVRYVYNKDGNQIYPYQIIYTGNGVTDGPTTITFATSTRTDTHVSYQDGFKVWTNYVISQITASFNGSNVRRYTLSYTTGNNGYRALLSSVQETGWDDNNTQTTLPAMSFGYVSSTTAFSWPSNSSLGKINGQSYAVGDANGDGINDVNVFYFNQVSSATGSQMDIDQQNLLTSVVPPDYWANTSNGDPAYPPQERGVRLVDVNGDGKADVVRGSAESGTALYLNTYTGSSNYGWAATTTYSGSIPTFESSNISTGIFGNVNGTGLPSYEANVPGTVSATAYIANGTAWDATTTIFAPAQAFPGSTPTATNSQLVDINGDGLDDWVYSDANNTYVLLNTGTRWESSPDPEYTIATTTLYKSPSPGTTVYYDRGIRFFDINGDGLPDMIHSYSLSSYNDSGCGSVVPNGEVASYSQVFLNTGHGWATSTTYTLPATITTGNVAGSGSCEWQGIYDYNEYGNWMGNGQQAQDVISTITYPKGGSTSITYGYTTLSGSNPQLPYNLLVVTKKVNHDGRGSNEETDYSYSGGLQYLPTFPPNVFDRKFAGFATTTETKSNSVTTTYYDQNNGVQASLGEQSDGYAQINHPFRIDVTTPQGTLVRKTLDRWDTISHASSTFVGLGEQAIEDFSSDGTHQDAITDYTYSTTTDDLLEMDQYGNLGKNDGRSTLYSYAASSSINLSVPVEKKLLIATSTATSTTVRALVVAGGGSGGSSGAYGCGGGGGGGGGVQDSSSTTLSLGTYTITVGGSDQNSSIGSVLVSTTGGAGGTCVAGSNGGSGGGGANGLSGGSGITGQGYAGGSGAGGDSGSGGGGAGGTGSPGTAFGNGGAAGNGITSNIGSVNVTYGGGGGGGSDGRSSGAQGGVGGTGGGGAGGSYATGATNGLANTGGGGGGAVGGITTGISGGSGGSGIVIISAPQGTLHAFGGSHSIVGGNDIWTFPSNGTWDLYSIVGSTTQVTDEQYLYDNLPFGSVSNGNLTQQKDWTSGSHYASSTKAYNSYGLVASSTDRDGNVTAYVYDSFDLYPATSTNALLQSTTFTYEYSNGKVEQTKDSNGAKTKSIYDGLGRLTEIDQSDVTNPSSLVTKSTIQYTDSTSTPSLVHESDYLNSATTTDTYDYYDGLSRLIQERKSSENNGTYAVTDKTYDTAGNLYSQSLPYFASGNGNTSATSTSSLFTYYTYDPLNRILAAVNAVGTTTNAYSKWTKTVTDPNGDIKDYISDAFSNLAQVVEHGNSSNATTTYTYDAANNLTNITDAAGNVRNFTYDGIGNELTAQDLHAISDSTFGSWAYSYDDQGNETSRTDPKSQTITHTYDALNRMLTESLTGSGTQITDTYDSCTNGIGHLCLASSTAARLGYAYDVLGHISNATTTVGGTNYPIAYSYDRQGNVTNLTNANGSQLAYTYNAAGLVDGLSRGSSGATSTVATLLNFSPLNQLGQILFGSGASTTYAYNPAELYRLTRIYTLGASIGTTTNALQDLNYTYDADGNILTRTDNSNTGGGQVVTYTYDNLNRLLTASTTVNDTNSYNQTFAYDALGNILTGPNGTYSYLGNTGSNYANPDAVTQIVLSVGGSAPTIAYDNSVISGNGTPLSSLTFSYTTGATTTNGLMVVAVQESPPTGSCSTDKVTGVTYNGVSLTDAGYYVGNTSPVNGALKTYYGFAPATSTHNVVVSASASCLLYATAATYSGVKQSGFPDASGSGNPLNDSGAVTLFQATTTTANNNAWAVLIGVPSATGIATAGSNTTIRQQQSGNLYYADSNGPVSPAGAIGLNWTMASSTHWLANYFSITPVISTPGSVSTTTYAYDNNGNLIQAVVGATTTTYMYDYANRLTAVGISGAGTTTYAYDAFGNRVSQTSPSGAIDVYPNQFFSQVMTTLGSSTIATSTEYLYSDNTLLATVDQPFVNGIATGSSTVRYVHSDNLGSTNVTSDTNGNQAERITYLPYGSVTSDVNTGTTTITRGFIGQYYDANSSLIYDNARYYNPSQGQFLSEDPIFLDNPNAQFLNDPQSLNSYSYARDNPISIKDTSGLSAATYAQGAAKQAGLVAAASALTIAAAALFVAASPVTVPATAIATIGIAASAIGIAATGIGAYSNYQSYSSGTISRDQFDYNNGQLTVGGLTSIAGFGVSSEASIAEDSASLIARNAAQGAQFEEAVGNALAPQYESLTSQVLLETKSGVRTRIDFLALNNGTVSGFEAKSSATAPLTANQRIAFPEIGQTGATVRSTNNSIFPYGQQLDPFIINVMRPQ